MYGIFEDLFDHSYFNPIVNLIIEYDFEDDIVTPGMYWVYVVFTSRKISYIDKLIFSY